MLQRAVIGLAIIGQITVDLLQLAGIAQIYAHGAGRAFEPLTPKSGCEQQSKSPIRKVVGAFHWPSVRLIRARAAAASTRRCS